MKLTDEQVESLWSPIGDPYRDLRIVSARAGTGKTSVLGAYVTALLDNWEEYFRPWQGLALLSYTNVARQELESKLAAESHGTLVTAFPHFTGTIDSFLNQFVFLPHGSSAMGATGRPKLVGEPHSVWEPTPGNQILRYFAGVSYQLDSTMDFDAGALARSYGRSKETVEGQRSQIETAKRALNRKRFATQSDANHFSYKTLEQHPDIARALAERIPVIVVDEAQDMTAVQHATLDLLIKAGVSHVVLIGDERQAIYEWNTARPALFAGRPGTNGWKSSTISGSFRCSPAICEALNSLSGDGSLQPVKGAKNEGYADPVQVRPFDANAEDARVQLETIVGAMAAALTGRRPHSPSSPFLEVAVLTRGRDDASHLRSLFVGESETKRPAPSFDDKRTRAFLGIVHHALKGNSAKAFSAYERLMKGCGDFDDLESMRISLTETWFGPEGDSIDYRSKVLEAIESLRVALAVHGSGTSPMIASCASGCDLPLPGIGHVLEGVKNDLEKHDASKPRRKGVRAVTPIHLSSLFAAEEIHAADIHPIHANVRIKFSTIHGVKGETYDGVILVQRKTTSACGCNQSSTSTLRIAGHEILGCEGKRLQYVGASRAAQLLCIAVEADKDAWERLLLPKRVPAVAI